MKIILAYNAMFEFFILRLDLLRLDILLEGRTVGIEVFPSNVCVYPFL